MDPNLEFLCYVAVAMTRLVCSIPAQGRCFAFGKSSCPFEAVRNTVEFWCTISGVRLEQDVVINHIAQVSNVIRNIRVDRPGWR